MALDYVDKLVVAVLHLHENCEVVVMGEVSSLNMELVENFMMTCVVSPNLLDMRVLEFTMKNRMLMKNVVHSFPMLLNLNVYLNLYVCHILYK
jgi:hypothetical protein